MTKQEIQKIYTQALDYLKQKHNKYYQAIKHYQLRFGKKKNSYGTCHCNLKVVYMHMYLCQYLEAHEIKDTILHEFAHAIEFELYGGFYKNKPHNKRWKRIARQLGISDDYAKTSTASTIIKRSKYVMVIKFDNQKIEYIKGQHRKGKHELNQPLMGYSMPNRKHETLNRIHIITWTEFVAKMTNKEVIIPNGYKLGHINHV